MINRRRIITFEAPALIDKTWATIPENYDHTTWYVVDDKNGEGIVAMHELLQQAEVRQSLGSLIKLWHDDVREPPDDTWLWARTNTAAELVLKSVNVDVLSMDHDLGGSDISVEDLRNIGGGDYLKLDGDETGVDLAKWIADNDAYPQEIIIHSMNPIGAGNIVGALQAGGETMTGTTTISVIPFSR